MTTPTFTTPPTAPARTQAPADYVTNFNAWIAWHTNHFVGEIGIGVAWIAARVLDMVGYVAAALASQTAAAASAQAAVNATTLVDTSTSSLTLAVAAKAVTLASAANTKTFPNGARGVLMRLGDPTVRISGPISAAAMSATPPTLTITPASAADISGAGGPYTDWLLMLADFAGLPAGQLADGLAKTSNIVAVTPLLQRTALAPVALTYASTVTPDLSTGKRFTLNASASFTLGNPSNTFPGDIVEILITNTAGSIVLATASAWKRQNGLFVLDPANGHTNKITGVVETVDGSGNATSITYNGLRNPS